MAENEEELKSLLMKVKVDKNKELNIDCHMTQQFHP